MRIIYIDSVYDISSKGREGGPSKGLIVVAQQIFPPHPLPNLLGKKQETNAMKQSHMHSIF